MIPNHLLTPANKSEIEFAEEGQRIASKKLEEATEGSDEQHSAAHEFIDWTTVKSFGTHALPCYITCPDRRKRNE